ncbi:hypothetical protein OH146_03135 [Salinibacterium sp. SYSU T00001]|uniref:hypothetical protein n=1 Tax=Homoserinimonas sedimenticola TaxID=2986805 RepID=UPI00223664A7|nr:hypothetical protein [Salinibacterium sedimenticola]MCW4384763.1 hypothetical protein [Salinibacterium sedimenticola]
MDIGLFFKALFRHPILLVLGVLVSVGAALFSGFTLEKGTFEPRAEQDYSASTTVLLESPKQSLFSAEIPPRPIIEGQTAGDTRNLADTAVIYAYLIGSDAMRELVEQEVGPLGEDESVSAIQRTTQPDGSERFPGDYHLPIIDVLGTSTSPARAEAISTAGAEVFKQYAAAQQEAEAVPEADRVTFPTLRTSEAEALEGSNPILPILAVGVGVFLAFVVLILIVDNAGRGRREAKARKKEEAALERERAREELYGDDALNPSVRRPEHAEDHALTH